MMSPVLLLQLSISLSWINGSLAEKETWRHSSVATHDQSDDANATTDASPEWDEFEKTMKQAEKDNKINLEKAKDGMNIFHQLFDDPKIQEAAKAADLLAVMKKLSSDPALGDDDINKIMEEESMKKLNSLMQSKLQAGEWEKLEGAFSDVLDGSAKKVTISGIPEGKTLEAAEIASNRTKLNMVLEQCPEETCISGRPTYCGMVEGDKVILYYCGSLATWAVTKLEGDPAALEKDCHAILQFSGNVQDDNLKLSQIESGKSHGNKWIDQGKLSWMSQVNIAVESDAAKSATKCKS